MDPSQRGKESTALEQAVSRAVRDNLALVQHTARELNQAIEDFVAACGSTRTANMLPAMLRAQTASASLSSMLEVLSRLLTASLQPARLGAAETLLPTVIVPPAEAPAVEPAPLPHVPPVPMGGIEAPAAPPPAAGGQSYAAPAVIEPPAPPVESTPEPVVEAPPEPEPAVEAPPPEPEPKMEPSRTFRPQEVPATAYSPEAIEVVQPEPVVPAYEPVPEPVAVIEEPATEPAVEPAAVAVEAAAAAAAPAKEFRVEDLPSEQQELHRRANRHAKVSMQDIYLLRPKDVQLGRQNKDICVRLRNDIEKARKEYVRRFGPILEHPVDYFHHWMVEVLGEGKPEALGEYPYPSAATRR